MPPSEEFIAQWERENTPGHLIIHERNAALVTGIDRTTGRYTGTLMTDLAKMVEAMQAPEIDHKYEEAAPHA